MGMGYGVWGLGFSIWEQFNDAQDRLSERGNLNLSRWRTVARRCGFHCWWAVEGFLYLSVGPCKIYIS